MRFHKKCFNGNMNLPKIQFFGSSEKIRQISRIATLESAASIAKPDATKSPKLGPNVHSWKKSGNMRTGLFMTKNSEKEKNTLKSEMFWKTDIPTKNIGH